MNSQIIPSQASVRLAPVFNSYNNRPLDKRIPPPPGGRGQAKRKKRIRLKRFVLSGIDSPSRLKNRFIRPRSYMCCRPKGKIEKKQTIFYHADHITLISLKCLKCHISFCILLYDGFLFYFILFHIIYIFHSFLPPPGQNDFILFHIIHIFHSSLIS